jgi:hypothetical protein
MSGLLSSIGSKTVSFLHTRRLADRRPAVQGPENVSNLAGDLLGWSNDVDPTIAKY